jgi:hypothetical protein
MQPAGEQIHAHPDVDATVLDALLDRALGPSPRVVAWHRLSDQQAAVAWDELADWVRWLARRYHLDARELPACRPRHSDLVEELSALRTAHQGAFDPAGSPSGPSDWHQTLALTRQRLRDTTAATGCRSGEHRAPTARGWAGGPDQEFLQHLDEAVRTDLAGQQ